jgi:hypothetical protein
MEHPREISQQELEMQDGQSLPAREAMSTVSLDPGGIDNFAMPINEAFALNYQSTDSVAFANAEQTVIVNQVDQDPDPGAVDHSTDHATPGRKPHG